MSLADVLRKHEDWGLFPDHGGDTHYVCSCDKEKRPGRHRDHLVSVILDLLRSDEAHEAVTQAVADEFFLMQGGADLLAEGHKVTPNGGDRAIAHASVAAAIDWLADTEHGGVEG